MKYKSYSKYKDSDIEWLVEIPKEWEVKRLKFLISQKITDGPHETPEFIDEGIPFLSVNGIQDDKLIFEGCRYISKRDHDQYKSKCSPQKNDILLGKAASVGKVAIVDVDFEFNIWSPLALIRVNKKILASYIYYSLKSDFLQDQVYILSTSNTQHNLSMDDIPKLWFATPNIKCQQKIVSFLDDKTAKIDKLVRNNKKQIELLKERRQATISQAVTKGLNLKAKMKDSGIDWLGEIPEEWKLKRLKYIFKVINGATPMSSKNEYWDGRISWITPDDLGKLDLDVIFDTERTITDLGYKSCGATVVPKGSLILSTRAPIGYLGMAGIALCTNQGCRSLVFRYQENLRYFYYLIYTARPELESLGQGSTFQELGKNKLESVIICSPSREEQAEIAKYLYRKTIQIDNLIKKRELQNQKLQEFRQSLISNVVTGKVKVI